MSDKFLGLGLTNLLGVFLFVVIMTVLSKVVFTKYHVSGISEIIQAV